MAWRRITSLAEIQPGNVRRGPHRMTQRLLHWVYCSQCGLLLLNNDVTRRALQRECVWED